MTKAELHVRLWNQFEVENGYRPEEINVVVQWAVECGYLVLPEVDPYAILASQMSESLRQQMGTHKGRRYRKNLAVRVGRGDEQKTLWGILDYAEPDFAKKWFTQRRQGAVDDMYQLKLDVFVWNDLHRDEEYVLETDLTPDMDERDASNGFLPSDPLPSGTGGDLGDLTPLLGG
jgi:hypothetical protein